MRYTLWSHNRLLGETDLGFIYRSDTFRCGWLQPTETGERLLPMACGVAPALRYESTVGPDPTARADVLAAEDYEQALELQLRGPNDSVIDTEMIAIVDTDYLLSIPVGDYDDIELDPESQAEIDAFAAECKQQREEDALLENAHATSEQDDELPRYQIQAYLFSRLPDHGW